MRLNVLKNHVPILDVTVDTPEVSERYEIYVGRAEDCHVRLDDPLISRHHFVLKNTNGSWVCEKLTQLGVITIRGTTSQVMDVRDGDEIKCGDYSIFVTEFSNKPNLYNEPEERLPAPALIKPTRELTPPAEIIDEDILSESPELEDELASEDALESTPLDGEENFSEAEFNSSELSGNEFSGGDLAVSGFESDGLDSISEDLAPEEKTEFFKTFVNYQLILFGEHAPYDRFIIDQDIIYIGRDQKKCQIILDDPEVSTVHAVIRKNNTEIILEDLNSSNGTILNGQRINKAQILAGSEFVIGSTSFTLETRSDLLDAESDRLMPVESGQVIEKEEIQEEFTELGEESDLDFESDEPEEKSIFKRIKKDPAFRKKAIYALAFITFLIVMFVDTEEPGPVIDPKIAKDAQNTTKKDDKSKVKLSPEQEEAAKQAYELGISFFDQEKYYEAEGEFKKVIQIDPTYKQGKAQAYLDQTIAGLKRLEEIAAQERAEKEKIATKKLVEELIIKAREAVKERQVALADSFFAQIIEKEPENIEVQQLKLELEAWQKEEENKSLAKAIKEAARKAMVDALSPGKTFYLKKEWYRAILKLEEFLLRKGSDEDLVKEASDMLADAKEQLSNELGPLLGKARSLKEGQDLKVAYEAYLDVLKVEPTNSEALNEVDDIKSQLETRSKRMYREAIIAESLSLFIDAKEKFQEVQQISPSDSEYYRKASDKLKNYLE